MRLRISRRAFFGGLAAGAALGTARHSQAAPLDVDVGALVGRLRDAMGRFEVPGVAAGLIAGDREWAGGLGVMSVDAPLTVDDQTMLPVGPLTMPITATAILRLVEQGRIQLDTPVRAYIPGFRVASETVSQQVTLLDCLTHLAGWWGDDLTDTGSGDDAIARYVGGMATLPQTVPFGRHWSFNIAAYSVAGRVLEIVTGKSFEEAIRTLVFDPLGMSRAAFNAIEVMSVPVSIGHESDGSQLRIVRPFGAPRGLNPALGALLPMRDVLKFARFHLGDGASAMSLPLLAYMRAPRTAPGAADWRETDGFGLGWMLWSQQRQRFAGITGQTPDGQQFMMVLHPDRDFALALFGNSASAELMLQEVASWAIGQLLGAPAPAPPVFDLPPEQLQPYAGSYIFADQAVGRDLAPRRYEVLVRDGILLLRNAASAPARLRFSRQDAAIVVEGAAAGQRAEFLRNEFGEIGWLRIGLRAVPRLRA
ncbi:MAG: serine hydrolase domain-containing protein [Dehalococcoidia bacterium]